MLLCKEKFNHHFLKKNYQCTCGHTFSSLVHPVCRGKVMWGKRRYYGTNHLDML